MQLNIPTFSLPPLSLLFHMPIPTTKRRVQNRSIMEIYSTKKYGHGGKAVIHWSYWSWQVIAECRKVADPSPHVHTSSSKSKKSRSKNGHLQSFLNSDKEVYDPEKCEHANWRTNQITKRRYHSKMAWKTPNLDDQNNIKGSSYSSSKSSRVYCCVHKGYEESINASYRDMRNLKFNVLYYFPGWPPLGGDC